MNLAIQKPQISDTEIKNYYGISLILFSFSVSLAFVLRLAFVGDLPSWISYPYVKQAHYHLAILGWLVPSFFLLSVILFNLRWKRYKLLLQILLFTAFASTLSFLTVGYSLPSIFWIGIHTVVCIFWCYRAFWETISFRNQISYRLFLTALLFFTMANVASLSLGPIINMGYRGTAFYFGTIQFYMHFLLNGFLLFFFFACIFYLFQRWSISYSAKDSKLFLIFQTLATILTYALSVTWSNPNSFIFFINSTGAFLQLIALYYFIRVLRSMPSSILNRYPKHIDNLFYFSLFSYIAKVIIQSVVILPVFAKISYTIHNFVVGFIHLMTLGIFSSFLFAMYGLLFPKSTSPFFTYSFLFGILMTESILFIQGLELWMGLGFFPNYYLIITIATAILSSSVIGFTWIYFRKKKASNLVMVD